MSHDYYKLTLALAGMVQAISLVKDIAQTGQYNPNAYQASIHSIFQTEPENIFSVYNGINGLTLGLEKLLLLLNQKSPRTITRSLYRYFFSVTQLQKKINRSPQVLEQISQRIKQAKKQVDYFHLTHPSVIANLADIYVYAICTLNFRIVIWGSQQFFHQKENMEKIRALFFAGVRAAVLWRQVGGNYWQLLFSHKKIQKTAEKILADIKQEQLKVSITA